MIDLCKCLEVEEGEAFEFEGNDFSFRVAQNKLEYRSKIDDGWENTRMTANDLFNSEIVRKKKFTETEKTILKGLNECGYKWIARDEDGTLYAFTENAEKHSNCWDNYANDCENIGIFNKLFQNVKWKDEEPTSTEVEE